MDGVITHHFKIVVTEEYSYWHKLQFHPTYPNIGLF